VDAAQQKIRPAKAQAASTAVLGPGRGGLYRGLMDDEATTVISCPLCSAKMTAGWIAIWNSIVFQKVRWQATKPGYNRLRVPQGAHVVLEPKVGGKDARVAMRCPSCSTIVLPPSLTYD
jgi:ribosomal protein S27E